MTKLKQIKNLFVIVTISVSGNITNLSMNSSHFRMVIRIWELSLGKIVSLFTQGII